MSERDVLQAYYTVKRIYHGMDSSGIPDIFLILCPYGHWHYTKRAFLCLLYFETRNSLKEENMNSFLEIVETNGVPSTNLRLILGRDFVIDELSSQRNSFVACRLELGFLGTT